MGNAFCGKTGESLNVQSSVIDHWLLQRCLCFKRSFLKNWKKTNLSFVFMLKQQEKHKHYEWLDFKTCYFILIDLELQKFDNFAHIEVTLEITEWISCWCIISTFFPLKNRLRAPNNSYPCCKGGQATARRPVGPAKYLAHCFQTPRFRLWSAVQQHWLLPISC